MCYAGCSRFALLLPVEREACGSTVERLAEEDWWGGRPNDLLIKLKLAHCTLREVSIKPVYAVDEYRKMKIGKLIPRISLLFTKSFFMRI